MKDRKLLDTVQGQYAAVARSGLSNDSEAIRSVAQAFAYTADDLASLPPQANMGLSCGNPIAVAQLRPGEVVVDLGCGGGLDDLLAAKKVGPAGRVIGIDMTREMIERARQGAAQGGATNVEFHQAEIDRLPLPDASVDCILSNCVINLAPDKPAVFREILRVLKPGGRVVISDIALKQPLPPAVAADVQAYVGCIAGAILISDYERMLRDAGFEAVVISGTGADLNVYSQASSGGCCSSSSEGCCNPTESSECHHPRADGRARPANRNRPLADRTTGRTRSFAKHAGISEARATHLIERTNIWRPFKYLEPVAPGVAIWPRSRSVPCGSRDATT